MRDKIRSIKSHLSNWFPLYIICGAVGTIICLGIYAGLDMNNHPEHYRYTVEYNGQTKKCKVDLPRVSEGKSSYWTGVVNLIDCEDGQDIFAASNVKIISKPKCGCGG